MIVDGKAMAARIYEDLVEEIATLPRAPRLGILTCSPNFETQKYLDLKQKKAHAVGIETEVVELDKDVTTEAILATVVALASRCDGVVVQLPLPAHIDTAAILQSIPVTHDVDALNPATTAVLSPVVGAIAEILKVYQVPIFERLVTVVGSGKLVGMPVAQWCIAQSAAVSVVTKDTADIAYYTRNADIIVSGAGVPGLITPTMVKDGVVILDAGTSEEGGMLRGDADSACAEKAALFTPVPGGIGPITIAVLLQNLVVLFAHRDKTVV